MISILCRVNVVSLINIVVVSYLCVRCMVMSGLGGLGLGFRVVGSFTLLLDMERCVCWGLGRKEKRVDVIEEEGRVSKFIFPKRPLA